MTDVQKKEMMQVVRTWHLFTDMRDRGVFPPDASITLHPGDDHGGISGSVKTLARKGQWKGKRVILADCYEGSILLCHPAGKPMTDEEFEALKTKPDRTQRDEATLWKEDVRRWCESRRSGLNDYEPLSWALESVPLNEL